MSELIHSILKKYWGYESFRPLQEDIIRSLLANNDTLALLPTGGGKSICFQVPAMAREGLCLVISPLIALMKDQVENLRKKNITAFAIYSGMSRQEVHNTLRTAGESNCKFLYVSPERVETKLFLEYLPSLGVNMIAVDEAHCISQWGYDFRPPYLRIAALRDELPGIPILALTASATQNVQEDICNKLAFKKHSIFRQSFERPNLSYSSFKVDSRINRIVEILGKVPGSGIVYCMSRKKTKEISDLLKMHGINADFYHAGLSQDERNQKQEAWIDNSTRVIVCTNAFGMGIDKPDVRIVVHADVPECLESYYQEAGRAGRDGKKSYAVLLYNERDAVEMRKQISFRFPSFSDIKKVYSHLMNFLQVPAGTGEGSYFEFDLQGFLKVDKLNSRLVLASLKVLEQEQLIVVSDQVFMPSKVEVISSRQRIEELEQNNPKAAEVVKTLLRNYQGIFDQPVGISEKLIAKQLRLKLEIVTEQLRLLDASKMISYIPQKETPQIYFVVNRPPTEDLLINHQAFNDRKEMYRARIESMIKYFEPFRCRSQFIAEYFGDAHTKECGVCDCCLEKKKSPVTQENFQKIHNLIVELIRESKSGIPHSMLTEKTRSFPRGHVKEVLRFMQAEQKLAVNAKGEIRLLSS